MDDATRHGAMRGDRRLPPGRVLADGALIEPAPAWLDELCSSDQRKRLRQVLAEGETLLREAQQWASGALGELARYETHIKDQGLTEAIAYDLSSLTGVGQIHQVFEAFANLAEPDAPEELES